MTTQEKANLTLGYGVGAGAVVLFSIINGPLDKTAKITMGLLSLGIIGYALHLKNK